MSIERLFVGQSFTPQLRGVNLVPPGIPSFADGTDQEIISALDRHYNGEVDLSEYWGVGDTRTMRISTIAANQINQSKAIPEQDLEFEIVNVGGKQLSNGKECAFIIQLKYLYRDILDTGWPIRGLMHTSASNSESWKGCARRSWLNSAFYNAFSESAKRIIKLHKNKTAKGRLSYTNPDYSKLVLEETEDYFSLPCEFNVYGPTEQSRRNCGIDEDITHWTKYQTENGRKKYASELSTSAELWWIRSPYVFTGESYSAVGSYGFLTSNIADDSGGSGTGCAVFPCTCI